MFPSTLTLTLLSSIFLTTLGLPSNLQSHSSSTLTNRDNQLTGPSVRSIDTVTLPPNVTQTPSVTAALNVTTPPLTCYSPPASSPLPHPSELDCLHALQNVLLGPSPMTPVLWSGTRGLRAAQWIKGSCRIALVAKTPFSEEEFEPARVALAAAWLVKTCVAGPYDMGGTTGVGRYQAFVVTITGTGRETGMAVVGGGIATS